MSYCLGSLFQLKLYLFIPKNLPRCNGHTVFLFRESNYNLARFPFFGKGEGIYSLQFLNHLLLFLFPFIRFNVSFRDWSPYAAKFIFRQICEKGHQLSDDPVQKINSICQKTVEDLRVILNDMEEFQSKVVPEDQNKRKLFHC